MIDAVGNNRISTLQQTLRTQGVRGALVVRPGQLAQLRNVSPLGAEQSSPFTRNLRTVLIRHIRKHSKIKVIDILCDLESRAELLAANPTFIEQLRSSNGNLEVLGHTVVFEMEGKNTGKVYFLRNEDNVLTVRNLASSSDETEMKEIAVDSAVQGEGEKGIVSLAPDITTVSAEEILIQALLVEAEGGDERTKRRLGNRAIKWSEEQLNIFTGSGLLGRALEVVPPDILLSTRWEKAPYYTDGGWGPRDLVVRRIIALAGGGSKEAGLFLMRRKNKWDRNYLAHLSEFYILSSIEAVIDQMRSADEVMRLEDIVISCCSSDRCRSFLRAVHRFLKYGIRSEGDIKQLADFLEYNNEYKCKGNMPNKLGSAIYAGKSLAVEFVLPRSGRKIKYVHSHLFWWLYRENYYIEDNGRYYKLW